MAKRELIDKSEVMMFVDDVFECQCDEKEAYELLDNVSTITEQEIVKPYLELLLKEMHSLEEINHDDNRYDKGYQHGRASCEAMVNHIIDNLLSEQEVKE